MTRLNLSVRAWRGPLASAGLVLAAALPASAWAKLPALTPEAAAKADEAKAKAAWTAQVDTYKLCREMDRVAAFYRAEAPKAGKAAPPATETPSCTEPGPFVYAPVAAPTTKPPIEASGAHSPTSAAVAPPSSTTPQSVQQPTKK